ncbi:MAG: hypothetical protein ABI787_05305 [Spartobacteria bacterium]
MKPVLTTSDASLLRAFESCALTPGQLPHRAHLRLAFIYLRLHPFGVALELLRSRLQKFLAHHGASASVYHETMTRAWLLAVRYFLAARPSVRSSAEFLRRCPVLLDKNIMATHYSPEHMMSPAARAGFLEPDLDPIPGQSDS